MHYNTNYILEPGIIMESNNYGKIEIIKELPKINNKRRARVRFLNTNYEQDFWWNEIKTGKIKDASTTKLLKINPEIIYETNDGPAIILEDLGDRKGNKWVKIRFINTGCEKEAVYQTFLKGQVKDFLKPSVCDIGYIGTPERFAAGSLDRFLYKRWKGMISRCYYEHDISYVRYGALGVTVDESWYNFNQFRYDSQNLLGFHLLLELNIDKNQYQIDKDYLQNHINPNQKIYSKSTCIWISRKFNAKIAFTNFDEEYISKYTGVYITKEEHLIYAKIYRFDTGELIDYGPFINEESAASFVYYYSPKLIQIHGHFPNKIIPYDILGKYFIKKISMYKLVN